MYTVRICENWCESANLIKTIYITPYGVHLKKIGARDCSRLPVKRLAMKSIYCKNISMTALCTSEPSSSNSIFDFFSLTPVDTSVWEGKIKLIDCGCFSHECFQTATSIYTYQGIKCKIFKAWKLYIHTYIHDFI